MHGVCRLSRGLPHLIGRFSARLLRQMGCSAFSKVRAIASLPTTTTTTTRPISIARLRASGSTAAICRNVPHSVLVHAHDTIRISSPSSRSHDCADEQCVTQVSAAENVSLQVYKLYPWIEHVLIERERQGCGSTRWPWQPKHQLGRRGVAEGDSFEGSIAPRFGAG